MTTTEIDPRQTDVEGGPDPKRFWALGIIAIAQLMIVLDASVVIVALPSAQHALHISVANRQWVMSAYTLAFGSLLLLGGRIADYLGRRRIFIVGLIGFAASSALAGLAQKPAMLFGARALQGAFAAVMAPAALSLLTVTFTEPRERARAFGRLRRHRRQRRGHRARPRRDPRPSSPRGAGRSSSTYRSRSSPRSAPARFIRESRGGSGRGYDLPGAATATGGLFLLVYGFTMAGTHGWGRRSPSCS